MTKRELLKNEGWGGRREGSGRKKTGLKRPNRSIRATEEEYELVMQFLKTLRANAKKNREEKNPLSQMKKPPN